MSTLLVPPHLSHLKFKMSSRVCSYSGVLADTAVTSAPLIVLIASMKRAEAYLGDLNDHQAVVTALVLLGDALRQKEDVQQVSNELLRVFHELLEGGAFARRFAKTSGLTSTLQCRRSSGLLW